MGIEALKKIKAKHFAPIYLLLGTEAFLMKEIRNSIIEHALDEEEHDFNLSFYDMEEQPVDVAIEDAETLPFMGERRVVVLSNPFFLTAEKSKSKVEHNTDRFLSYIQEAAPYTIFVIQASYEKLDERKKIVKQLKKQAEVIEVQPLGERDLKMWMKEKALQNGADLSDAASEELLKIAGVNLSVLSQEINKMAMYIGVSEPEITVETVKLLAAKSIEHSVFELIEKMVHRRVDEALELFYDLVRNNEEPIKLHALIANQFRLLYQVKDLSEQGYSQQKMAGILRVHPYRVKLASQQGGYFERAELMKMVDDLAEADYLMKSGKIDKQLAMEMLLIKLAPVK
ncbi:DNA polymerase III subunit delta [Sutcliffiella horikoshii]|uniref:DNA polymerase III subunit delta n=1 Tax=Sutcliffiella horikoshii TaxID=79883 RepID=A0A1Y0CPX2_9BACI|nr:DNA polymerase III subunit delta [Sutcliffiella horikoshii]ART77350.1 DNA polymerase III subunit delta [Sutcliffiella horikoshii]TYS59203.1 DNA polymerase III subunit delta [Sutcliffiella horikoshii]